MFHTKMSSPEWLVSGATYSRGLSAGVVFKTFLAVTIQGVHGHC